MARSMKKKDIEKKRKEIFRKAVKVIPERRVREADLLEPLKAYFNSPEDNIAAVRQLTQGINQQLKQNSLEIIKFSHDNIQKVVSQHTMKLTEKIANDLEVIFAKISKDISNKINFEVS